MGVCPKCGEAMRIPSVSEARPAENASSDSLRLEPGEEISEVVETNDLVASTPARKQIEADRIAESDIASRPKNTALDVAGLGPLRTSIVDLADPAAGSDRGTMDLAAENSTGEALAGKGLLVAEGLVAEETTDAGSGGEATEIRAIAAGNIVLPRWVVYFQASMLGVCAATFFVFGMMVGNVTSTGPAPS